MSLPVKAYDKVHEQMLHMADYTAFYTLVGGITKYESLCT